MNKEILKKALLRGIGSGVLTWVIYALVFEMLIERMPAKDAFFSRGNIIFLIVITIIEIIVFYFTLSKKKHNNVCPEDNYIKHRQRDKNPGSDLPVFLCENPDNQRIQLLDEELATAADVSLSLIICCNAIRIAITIASHSGL